MAGAAAAGPPVGWRTDGTGTYPRAAPPVKWSPQENVVWKTPLPAWSNATPIIVGERVFVCSEPTDLVCLNLADGKILWRRSNTYQDWFTPQQAARAAEDARKAAAVRAEMKPLQKRQNELTKKLRQAPDDAALKKESQYLKKRLDQFNRKLQPLTLLERPKTFNLTGYSSPTPVSDGKFVYVHTGMGTTACYDLDGNRKWIARPDKPLHDWAGHSNSPLLVGGKLITHVVDVVAQDTATGKELWRTPSKWLDVFGSPVHVKVGRTDLYVDPNGDVMRVADGRPLARALCPMEFSGPIHDGGVLYFVRNGGKALKLPEEAGETLACRLLWQMSIRKDRYYASSLVHDGLIYAVTRGGVLSVVDAATGKLCYEEKLTLGKAEEDQFFSSVALAGDYVYVSHKNGTTAVLAAGGEYRPITVNKLEPFRSCLVFLGKRMYVRTLTSLYCIGR